MRVKILKPWICGGKNPPVGKVIDLPHMFGVAGTFGLLKVGL